MINVIDCHLSKIFTAEPYGYTKEFLDSNCEYNIIKYDNESTYIKGDAVIKMDDDISHIRTFTFEISEDKGPMLTFEMTKCKVTEEDPNNWIHE